MNAMFDILEEDVGVIVTVKSGISIIATPPVLVVVENVSVFTACFICIIPPPPPVGTPDTGIMLFTFKVLIF